MAHFMHMVLEGLSRWPDSPLIRPFTGTETEYSWGLITFGEFRRDLEKTAEYYQKTLFSAGLKAGDVVGLWYVVISVKTSTSKDNAVFCQAYRRTCHRPRTSVRPREGRVRP